MKIAVILSFLIAALGGGGYFAWTTFFSGGDQAVAGIFGGGDEVRYVEIERLTAPFIRDGRFVQYVVLDVSLEVPSAAAESRVRQLVPRLRDAFLSELHRLARTRSTNQRLINVARVKARLLNRADGVLGPDVVNEVLVQLAH
ncbi:MAG: hypothetical protein IIA00_08125 [Proteobacteria bacterium]|nr:hypothetical protein [Pseudomonadota bacterium]